MSTISTITSTDVLESFPAGSVVQDANGEQWFKIRQNRTPGEQELWSVLTGEQTGQVEQEPEGWDWVCIHGDRHSAWLIMEDADRPLRLVYVP